MAGCSESALKIGMTASFILAIFSIFYLALLWLVFSAHFEKFYYFDFYITQWPEKRTRLARKLSLGRGYGKLKGLLKIRFVDTMRTCCTSKHTMNLWNCPS